MSRPQAPQPVALELGLDHTRSFGDNLGSMSGLPGSGHGRVFYEYTPFCNEPGGVCHHAAELTFPSLVGAEAVQIFFGAGTLLVPQDF